jgi:ElaB/YqjD/DUF883 family membrane-anchored ribosome-binding protein
MNEYRKELDSIRDDIKELRTDLKSLIESFKGNGKEAAQSVNERISEFATERLGHLKDAANVGVAYVKQAAATARCYGRMAVEKTQRQLEERPVTTLLVALGAGVILGRLLRRR